MYWNTIREGPSHNQGQHAQKVGEVRPHSLRVMRAADRQTNRQKDRHTNWVLSSITEHYGALQDVTEKLRKHYGALQNVAEHYEALWDVTECWRAMQ